MITLSDNQLKEIFRKKVSSGAPSFEYKDSNRWISYKKDEYLKVSHADEVKLEDWITIGDITMKSNIIAFYKMDEESYELLMPTVEWNGYPEIRQQKLYENNTDNLGFKCVNLRICSQDKNSIKILKRAA